VFYRPDKRVGAILENFPRERTWLLPALEAVQEEEGWLSLPSLEAVAAYLRIPKSEVYGVATHYPEFRLTKPGAQIVRVCTGVSCRLLGGVELLRRVGERFGLKAGETSSDGRVTLEEADCFFLCSMAPLVEVDRRCHGRVGPADLDRLFDPVPARRAPESPPLLSKPVCGSPPVALEQLRVQSRAYAATGLRLLVGVGSCSESVGADVLLDRLADEARRQKLSAVVSETGCSGMCHAAPVVELFHDGWPRITLKGVTVEDVAPLVSALKFDRLPPGIEAVAWQGQPWGFIPGLNREPFLRGQRRALLERVGTLDPDSVAEALSEGSYHALARALERGDPTALIEEVKASGLQGRGGAYFAAALKWEACRNAPGSPKYLVVNGEEGEPGIFKDRHLMEGDPHRLLEGILLAAFAAGASRGILYIHGEADLSARRMATALRSAEAAGLLGERILGSEFSFHLELRRGAGGFVLGEETALLESIEGQRAMPRTRPPFPVEAGLWGKPTVINNVETLSAVPLIVDRGAAWFRALGEGRGTKLFGLSGSVVRPGIVEVEMGVTLRHLIDEIGGGSRDGQPLRAALVGGPSGVVVHSGKFDEPMTPGGGVSPGTGGVVALGEGASIRDVVRALLAFNARESCGKCTPCREGTARLLDWLDGRRLEAGVSKDRVPADLRDLAEVVRAASLCGLGQAAPLSLLSALDSFPEEMA
jgi:NADH:ubiquinone oxidoreductase subunit F (NADH-binding)/NADH:ubiquinone oxidoreductase subunit E